MLITFKNNGPSCYATRDPEHRDTNASSAALYAQEHASAKKRRVTTSETIRYMRRKLRRAGLDAPNFTYKIIPDVSNKYIPLVIPHDPVRDMSGEYVACQPVRSGIQLYPTYEKGIFRTSDGHLCYDARTFFVMRFRAKISMILHGPIFEDVVKHNKVNIMRAFLANDPQFLKRQSVRPYQAQWLRIAQENKFTHMVSLLRKYGAGDDMSVYDIPYDFSDKPDMVYTGSYIAVLYKHTNSI